MFDAEAIDYKDASLEVETLNPSDGNHADVIVLGLGGMGSAAAAHVAMRGNSVIGLEQFRPNHDLGSSHGETRIIREAYFESPDYVPLLQRSYDLWRELEQTSGQDLMTVTGGLNIGTVESGFVSGVYPKRAGIRTHGRGDRCTGGTPPVPGLPDSGQSCRAV